MTRSRVKFESNPFDAESHKPAHAYRRVAEAIRLRIISGELNPGDRLPPENDLARDEGVGRTTVREALRLLSSARLVEIRRGVQGGAFVIHPNASDLDELWMTGLSLMTMNGDLDDGELHDATTYMMPTVARIAALQGSDEERGALVVLAASLAKVRNDEQWVEVGRQFNTLLIQMTRNRVLAMFLKPLMRVSPRRYREQRLVPGWREETAERYRELADAIRSHASAEIVEEVMVRLRKRYVPPTAKAARTSVE